MSASVSEWANNAAATLAAGITSSQTTITLTSGEGATFPALSSGEFFVITIQSVSNVNTYEIAYCTARSSDTLTVTRGQEGTTGQAFNAGDTVQNRPTAGTYAGFVQWAATGLQSYTGAGTSTFTVPPGVYRLDIEAWAPGGGGGGCSNANGCGGGGGGGEYRRNVFSVTPGDTITINLGAAGAGVLEGNGTNAGDTVITDGATTFLHCVGGKGGVAGNSTLGAGGAGGTGGSGGAFVLAGMQGQPALELIGATAFSAGEGGFAFGSPSVWAGINANGDPSIMPGAGGGGVGSSAAGTGFAGGGGGPGAVLIKWG